MAHSHTTADSARTHTSKLPPEIWDVVAEHIHGKRTFMQLVQVCHSFHEIFLPFLHRDLPLLLSRRPADNWHMEWPIPAYVKHVRVFEVILYEFIQRGFDYHMDMNEEYGMFLANMLEQMPNLQSFRWNDSSYQEEFETALILRSKRLLRSLKDCKMLKHLSIQFGNLYLRDGVGADNCWTSLSSFQNLTSLELYHFFGEESKLIQDIAILLSESPHLKCLGLGQAHDVGVYQGPEVIITNGEYRFLEKLCTRYASCQGTQPLNLRTLKLGHGMFVFLAESSETGNQLKKLVKLEGLKTLHVFNGLVSDDEDADSMEILIDWSILADCRSIRQLAVSRISADVALWLTQGGKTVQELLVTDYYSVYDRDLDNFNALAFPALSMLYLKELYADKKDLDELEDIDSALNASEISEEDNTVEVESQYEDMPARLDISSMTVLDRLQDGGATITRLAISLDFMTQWYTFTSHLPKLRLLTQLRLDPKGALGGSSLRIESSPWPKVQKDIEIAKRYVQLAKMLCPSLQYAKIRDWAWQITVPQGLALGPDASSDIYSQIELRSLDYDEHMSIELFSYHNVTNQSGLLEQEGNHPWMHEEESESIDLQEEEGHPVRDLSGQVPDMDLPEF